MKDFSQYIDYPRPPYTVPKREHCRLGGLTEEQRDFAGVWSQWWIDRAFRTDAITDFELQHIGEACRAMYAAAKLPVPNLVMVVPSPLVMALAGTSATRAATAAATRAATDAATRDATYAATDAATRAALRNWWDNYQGGAMWCSYDALLTFIRRGLGLTVKEHKAYSHAE